MLHLKQNVVLECQTDRQMYPLHCKAWLKLIPGVSKVAEVYCRKKVKLGIYWGKKLLNFDRRAGFKDFF